jgi:hypothetical protein
MWVYSTIAAAAISFFAGWYVNGLRLNAEIESLHATWNEAYSNQVKATLDKEHDLNQLNTQIEVKNEKQAKAIDDAHVENLKLATTIKRLQHTASSSNSTMPKTSTAYQYAGTTTQSGFSDESISLLVELAREADDAARYANTCHEWAVGVTQELDKQQK